MVDFICHLTDGINSVDEKIVFSQKEIHSLHEQSHGAPISPLIVEKIETSVRRKGLLLLDERKELFLIAKQIITDTKHLFYLAACRVNESQKMPDPSLCRRTEQSTTPNKTPLTDPVVCFRYTNPITDLQSLETTIANDGLIPLLWSSVSGFDTSHLSRNFSLFNGEPPDTVTDLQDALRYVISQRHPNVAYVFEDIHYFMGRNGDISTDYGEVRALIKAIFRSFAQNDGRVYFFLPYSFELPSELATFLQSVGSTGKYKQAPGLLDRLGQKMTSQEYLAKTKPVIGIGSLLDRLVQTLCRKEINNPLLVGHPGVGKTAMVEGFAMALAKNKVPSLLQGRTLYAISLSN